MPNFITHNISAIFVSISTDSQAHSYTHTHPHSYTPKDLFPFSSQWAWCVFQFFGAVLENKLSWELVEVGKLAVGPTIHSHIKCILQCECVNFWLGGRGQRAPHRHAACLCHVRDFIWNSCIISSQVQAHTHLPNTHAHPPPMAVHHEGHRVDWGVNVGGKTPLPTAPPPTPVRCINKHPMSELILLKSNASSQQLS